MLEINPTYVLDEHQQTIAVQLPIGQFQQIEAILKAAGHLTTTESPTPEDTAWLEANLTPTFLDDEYNWQEGELEVGQPVKFIPGIGIIIEETA
jgi:hypothetical protein